MEYDVFICHAGEDKQKVVVPLAEKLREHRLRVWLDTWEIRVGDRLHKKINDGLADSRFGVIVISRSSVTKEFTLKEMEALAAKEIDGKKVILPVRHDISHKEILENVPLLADRIAASTDDGIKDVAQKLVDAIKEDANSEAEAPAHSEGKQQQRATSPVSEKTKDAGPPEDRTAVDRDAEDVSESASPTVGESSTESGEVSASAGTTSDGARDSDASSAHGRTDKPAASANKVGGAPKGQHDNGLRGRVLFFRCIVGAVIVCIFAITLLSFFLPPSRQAIVICGMVCFTLLGALLIICGYIGSALRPGTPEL